MSRTIFVNAIRRFAVVTCLASLLGGCATVHYLDQAAAGQSEVLEKARPMSEVLADPATPPTLADKLKLAEQIRAYAISELKLPNNASYTRYADVQRDYVLWNVVSTPALSLVPEQSCFPVAGCFAYRGYYKEDEAKDWAAAQQKKGDDVFLYGVPAYSTLGWFADPLLNTTVRYGEVSLARLIFHELAHQIVYVKGDSAFNEAFATAVELEGIERWIHYRNDAHLLTIYRDGEAHQAAFQQLMEQARDKLDAVYHDQETDAQKRERKAAILEGLRAQYEALKTSWHGYGGYDHWFNPVPNNAHLASLATYHALVPAFRELIREKNGDMAAFYTAVKSLAEKDRAARDEALAALNVAAVSGELQPKAQAAASATSVLK